MARGIARNQALTVHRIISVHYFEYFSGFSFPGESHNFWELLYVDSGDVIATGGVRRHSLKEGEIIFHKPNEFHRVDANERVAPNLVVIAFECVSKSMRFFENKMMKADGEISRLFAWIVREARGAFRNELNDPYYQKLDRAGGSAIGAEQLIKLYLERILITLIRENNGAPPILPDEKKRVRGDEMYEKVLEYLKQRIHTHVSIEQICRDNLLGPSRLQRLFRLRNGCGVIEYFCRMKIEEAKRHIRNKNMNFTEIADILGYRTIHYFCRQFKKIVGVTPSQYAASIRSLSEKS